MKTLPKYFVVKRDENDPRWHKYAAWLEETYSQAIGPSYALLNWKYSGYDGSKDKSLEVWDTIKDFENNPTLITLDQWEAAIKQEVEGYLAPYDLFNGRIKKDTLFTKVEDGVYNDATPFSFSMPAEIVETWPVKYKEMFREGDYVVAIPNIKLKGSGRNELVGRYVKYDGGNDDSAHLVDFSELKNISEYRIWSRVIRKATPQEIEKSRIEIDPQKELLQKLNDLFEFAQKHKMFG